MVKKKQNQAFDPSEIIHKTSLWYNVRGVLIIFLWVVFTTSVSFKLLFGRGITSFILGTKLTYGSLLAPGPLLEVAKALGICSLFIVWIYAELGKRELGRRYTELLSDFCKHYHLRALSYILAMLACLYISAAGTLESAGIAMLIAFLGLWDQTRVLVGFIFTPAVRKELALRQWDKLFSLNKNQGQLTNEMTLSNMYILASNISVEDECFDKLCRNMAKGILSYANQDFSDFVSNKDSIITTSHVWERLLNSRSDHEQFLISYHILTHVEDYLKGDQLVEEKRFWVCAGYMYWRSRYVINSSNSETTGLHDNLLRMLTDLDLLYQKLHNTQTDLMHCLFTLYASFCWMCFLCSKINLNPEMLQFFLSYPRKYDNSYKNLIKLFVSCTFNEPTCEKYFDTAWNQIKKH